MSSISIVSNHPPLLSLSLSTKEKEDLEIHWLTYRRRESSQSIGLYLECGFRIASAVNKTVKIVPREKSEWDFLPESAPNYDSALCALNCRVVDFYPLPEDAVGTLVILRVEETRHPKEWIQNQYW